MPDVTETLRKVRTSFDNKGPKDEMKGPDDEMKGSSRMVKLTESETKSLEPYQAKPGEEIVLEMSGTLEQDGHFHVMSVSYSEGGAMKEGPSNLDSPGGMSPGMGPGMMPGMMR